MDEEEKFPVGRCDEAEERTKGLIQLATNHPTVKSKAGGPLTFENKKPSGVSRSGLIQQFLQMQRGDYVRKTEPSDAGTVPHPTLASRRQVHIPRNLLSG